ncbi:hypothetical protein D3C81_2029740 [compost metagenome]
MQGAGARLGAAGFDAAQVTLGNPRDQGEVELAQARLATQQAQLLAGGGRGCRAGKGADIHTLTLAVQGVGVHDLRGH